MKRGASFLRAGAFLGAAFLGGMAGSWMLQPGSTAAGMIEAVPGKTGIVATFGVGGVVGSDGKLWQYRPDKKRWMSLDESYAVEGEGTSIFPLPVPIQDVRHLETFGFLVTKRSACWLYDFEQRQWEEIGSPPVK